jgi:hypothetical protein
VLPFKVMVDDNFHYMDEDERYEHGTFATVEEAIAACRKLVDQSLADCYKPGMTAAELYDQYTSFGDEPFIMAPPGGPPGAIFSARDYARSRLEAVCTGAGRAAHT